MYIFKLRRDDADRWTELNPVLADGEPGFERDTRKIKYGDGVTPWNNLPYFGGSGGDAGNDGASAYDIWLEEGNTGTIEDFLSSLVGPQGPRGLQGIQGVPGDEGPQGVAGPRGFEGPQGADGASAYEVWVGQGNVGDINDYLASLIGPKGDKGDPGDDGAEGPQGDKGDPGDPGKSAYDIWVEAGNVGDVNAYLLSLKGEKGDPGDVGPAGPGALIYDEGVVLPQRGGINFVGGLVVVDDDATNDQTKVTVNEPVAKRAWARRAAQLAAQGGGAGNLAKVTWDTNWGDTDGMLDLAGKPTRITIKTAGFYTMQGTASFATPVAAGHRFMKIDGFHANGAAGYSYTADIYGASGLMEVVFNFPPNSFVVGDWFEVYVATDGNAVNAVPINMQIWRIGPS